MSVVRPELEHPVLDMLVERGAGGIAHPGGTLLEHLRRVAALLGEWGASEDVQMAGLCHACYGTDGFPASLLRLDERDVLAGRIGRRAEAWVYLYASCDRTPCTPPCAHRHPHQHRDRCSSGTASPVRRHWSPSSTPRSSPSSPPPTNSTS